MKPQRTLDHFLRNTNSKNTDNDQNETDPFHHHSQPNHSFLPRHSRSNKNFRSTLTNRDIDDSYSETENESNSLSPFDVHISRLNTSSNSISEKDDTDKDTENDDNSHHESTLNHGASISLISKRKRYFSQNDIPPELQPLFLKVNELFKSKENHEINSYDMHCKEILKLEKGRS